MRCRPAHRPATNSGAAADHPERACVNMTERTGSRRLIKRAADATPPTTSRGVRGLCAATRGPAVETATDQPDAHRRGVWQHSSPREVGNSSHHRQSQICSARWAVSPESRWNRTRTISSCTSSTTDSTRWGERRREGRVPDGDPLCLRRFRPAAGGRWKSAASTTLSGRA